MSNVITTANLAAAATWVATPQLAHLLVPTKGITAEWAATVCGALANGAKVATALATAGPVTAGHTRTDLVVLAYTWVAKGQGWAEATPASVQGLRNGGASWGTIAVATGCTEVQVRKLYTGATGVAHKGLRVGKGGRQVANRPELYQGERHSTGAVAEAPQGKLPNFRTLHVGTLRNATPAEVAEWQAANPQRAEVQAAAKARRTKRTQG